MQSEHTFEFAKRWFHRGEEISPFPLRALHELLTNPSGLVETFRGAVERGWTFPKQGTGPGMVSELLYHHGINPIFIRKILKVYKVGV
jgi:hypothetical protein